MSKNNNPVIGQTCPALTNEDYNYHLSGDAASFCLCLLNNEGCRGRIITNPDDQSSSFFSRGKCSIDFDRIKSCPLYGMGKETFKTVLKEKTEKELNEKLNKLG
jgi:hypothetical protein